jgi:UDP-N-acetylglucosamine diphosphorylase/glucosamine-1-phosphate N-acetyltransferase
MKVVFHDNGLHLKFAPLTLTRTVAHIRMGLFTSEERWMLMLGKEHFEESLFVTQDYLSKKFPQPNVDEVYLHINAGVIPDSSLVREVRSLKVGEELRSEKDWIARKGDVNQSFEVKIAVNQPLVHLENKWDLFQKNATVLASDYFFHTKERSSQPISKSNTIIGDSSLIFLEEGAIVEACVLNTNSGPIYIGAHAEVMEGSLIRGPFALGEHGGVKMGAKIYGATSIGPHCKVGGEISNSIFIGYSNKGHDGFLGNSLIGEWCNLGADTNSSNLKNNYGKVKVYSYETEAMEQTDVQFLGLIMGDHSKCGINTMFNTATVVGVSANVFGADFPAKYIPSFAWGSYLDSRFELDKAFETAEAMMGRRGLELTKEDKLILRHIFDMEQRLD